ncbi:hypothetical protein MPSEU_000765700 [Mayamaea pseudoterrestris]|nr:hypothetical protein MPSEU_000765700 [Mayamaea pseudoterrestris]
MSTKKESSALSESEGANRPNASSPALSLSNDSFLSYLDDHKASPEGEVVSQEWDDPLPNSSTCNRQDSSLPSSIHTPILENVTANIDGLSVSEKEAQSSSPDPWTQFLSKGGSGSSDGSKSSSIHSLTDLFFSRSPEPSDAEANATETEYAIGNQQQPDGISSAQNENNQVASHHNASNSFAVAKTSLSVAVDINLEQLFHETTRSQYKQKMKHVQDDKVKVQGRCYKMPVSEALFELFEAGKFDLVGRKGAAIESIRIEGITPVDGTKFGKAIAAGYALLDNDDRYELIHGQWKSDGAKAKAKFAQVDEWAVKLTARMDGKSISNIDPRRQPYVLGIASKIQIYEKSPQAKLTNWKLENFLPPRGQSYLLKTKQTLKEWIVEDPGLDLIPQHISLEDNSARGSYHSRSGVEGLDYESETSVEYKRSASSASLADDSSRGSQRSRYSYDSETSRRYKRSDTSVSLAESLADDSSRAGRSSLHDCELKVDTKWSNSHDAALRALMAANLQLRSDLEAFAVAHLSRNEGKSTGSTSESSVPCDGKSDINKGEHGTDHSSLADTGTYPVQAFVITDPYGEQGTYTGPISSATNLPHGYGRLEYDRAGRWYEGNWQHGSWTGHGKLSNGEGDYYEGEFKNGHKHGRGIMEFAYGRVFVGEYIKSQMIEGKMTYQDGSTYTGSWVNGMRHGKGRCEFMDHSVYEGEFSKNEFSGNGKMLWSDGGWYEGNWLHGEMDGYGKEVHPDGTLRHEGQWRNGMPVRM